MRCMMDTNGYSGYSEKPSNVGRVRNQMRETTGVDADSFCYAVGHGFCWMGGIMRGGMQRGNWVEQQLIGLDFDNKDESIEIEDAVERLAEYDIFPFCAYYTYSATKEHPRYRLVIALDEPCEDPDVMEMAIGRLLYLLPEADQSCKDIARLFFGAPSADSVMRLDGWEGYRRASLRDICSIPVEPEAVDEIPRKKAPAAACSYSGSDKVDLDALRHDADLLGMVQADTGEVGKRSGACVKFNHCPICGHHDCFAYYPEKNRWRCFSTSNMTGIDGGSAIDYVMARDSVSFKDAIHFLSGTTNA